MNRLAMIALGGALIVAGGCHSRQYQSQSLGQVNYAQAFEQSKAVFSQYFSIESADAAKGKIVGRAKEVQAAPDRLLGSTPARQIAVMRVRRKGDTVVADVRVEIQRQDTVAARQMQPVTVDTELPNRTPAQENAPLTAEQEEFWQTTGRDEGVEQSILADLIRRLAPK